MRRRDFVVASASGLLAGLAGCFGPDQESLDERPPENEVEDAIRRAVGLANGVAVELRGAGAGPTDLDVDVADLRDRLASAREELDAAASSEAADGFQDAIDDAGSYVDAVGGLVDAVDAFAGVGDDLESLDAALSDGDYEAAVSELAAVGDAVDEAVAATGDAEDDLSSVDEATLGPYGARTADLEAAVEEAAALADAARDLVDGYERVLEGAARLDDGRAEFESGNYGAAESEFDAAGDAFADAGSTFESGAGGADTPVDDRFATAQCRATNLEDAAGHFADAAAAADAGDPVTANDEYQAGDAALDEAQAC